ncbi:MAG: HIT domain-containing protein [Thaumarchaeota archaeon]|nr:HIT domain-containing protein [Nitrososphaerota archaeon]
MSAAQKRIFNSASVSSEDCVFCKIIRGQLPSNKVYDDKGYVAFLDINPFSRGHTLVCPKAHGETLWDMKEDEIGGLFTAASKVSKGVMHATGAEGFRILQNNGEASNQVVAHVHVHVIPVMMEDKGKPMGRIKVGPEEMASLAEKIKQAIG